MEKGKSKIAKVMDEFKHGSLHSSAGPLIHNPKQAVAIALSEARNAGAKIPEAKKKKASPMSAIVDSMRGSHKSDVGYS